MDLKKLRENILSNTREYRPGESVTIDVAVDADVSGAKNDIEWLSIKLKGWDLTDGGEPVELSKKMLSQIFKGMPELFTFLLDMAMEVVKAPLGKLTNLKT